MSVDVDREGQPTATDTLSPAAFKALFRHHPAGVAVITLRDGEALVGFTATSVISVSADPPLLAFSVAGTSSSWPALQRAEHVVVNFLAADQVDTAARFATSGIDRFGSGGWALLPTGEPVLDDTDRWLRARVLQRIPAGASFLVILEALSSSLGDRGVAPADREPLVYHDRVYHGVGGHSAL
jgi:flavin reductase (DIM6/NTAB) family NADH-FMN oxidoreductase RutF